MRPSIAVSIGLIVEHEVETTPGRLSRRSSTPPHSSATRSAGNCVSRASSAKTRTLSVANPPSSVCRFCSVLTSKRGAEGEHQAERDLPGHERVPARQRVREDLCVIVPGLSAGIRATRVAPSAGNRPKTIPVTTDRADVKSSTEPSG